MFLLTKKIKCAICCINIQIMLIIIEKIGYMFIYETKGKYHAWAFS